MCWALQAVYLGAAEARLEASRLLLTRPKKRIGRPRLPDEKLVAEIEAVIPELPTYG
jgi:hypothetical protein